MGAALRVNVKGLPERLRDKSTDLLLIEPRRSKWKEGFFMGIQSGFQTLTKMNLSSTQYKIIIFIMSKMDFENKYRGTQKKIAEFIGVSASNLSPEVKKLCSRGLLIKGDDDNGKFLRLNACIAYKGRRDNSGEFEDLIAEDMNLIPELEEVVI